MRNKKKIILIGVLISLIFILVLITINKLAIHSTKQGSNKKNNYICLKESLAKDSIIYEKSLIGCIGKTEEHPYAYYYADKYQFENNYDDDDKVYYIKESTSKNKMLERTNVYWKLDLLKEKSITSEDKEYKIYIDNDGYLYTKNITDNTREKLFDLEELESFAISDSKNEEVIRLLLLTKKGNVYTYSKNYLDIIKYSNDKNISFLKLNLNSIKSFHVVEQFSTIYAVDNNNNYYEINFNEINEKNDNGDTNISNQDKEIILTRSKVFYKEEGKWYCGGFCLKGIDRSNLLSESNRQALYNTFASPLTDLGKKEGENEYSYSIEDLVDFFEKLMNIYYNSDDIKKYFLEYYNSTDNRYHFHTDNPIREAVKDIYFGDSESVGIVGENIYIVETESSKIKIKSNYEYFHIISNTKY